MKCKYCDGTGTSNWCINGIFQPCEYCNGTGEVEVVGDSVTDVCDKCGGTGFFCEMRTGDVCELGSPCPHQEPMTNEEWLKSCNTEQLADALMKIFVTRTFCHLCPEGDVCDIGYKCKYSDGKKIEDWMKWLKKPHKE